MKTLILDGTAISLQAAMTTSAATTNPTFVTNYADNSGSGITEGATDGSLNGSTDVSIVPAPSGTNRRVIKNITIYNGDTAAVTVLIKYDNNATQRTLVRVTLAVGDTWTTDGVFDSNGNLKQITGNVNLATNVTGTLPVANGGTGATTITGVIKGNGTSAFTAATAGTDYVTPTGSETLTNKTLTNPTVTNYTETAYTANTSTAITVSLTNGTVQILTLTGNATITMPTASAGKSFIILLRQDGTGGRSVTWSTVNWASATAPTITSTASKQDIFSFFSDGTRWYGCTLGQNYTQ
jgi:hypothetical protein